MKKTILYFAFVVMYSCNNSVDFNLNNSSLTKIDSLIITNNFDTIQIIDLKVNSKTSKELLFIKKKPKSDGSYKISIYKNGKVNDTTFGYFSNGMPLDKSFNINITEKQIKINAN